ncbi:MAG: pyridoxine 5'-phosphate synthase [Gammaproteobacteria bacterium]|nr:pyridoxine 5'-phosphate synthase [Gammaproteobacteria bacterium]
MKPILLGVNIDHVATIRQARGTMYPGLVAAASAAIDGGADSITVHLREDRRHIQDQDVYDLMQNIDVPLNLEMAITDEMLGIAVDLKPAFCCLVPEKREELTTEGGLDVAGNLDRVKLACQELNNAGIRVSLFIDPEMSQIEAANQCGANIIEIHTGRYAETMDENDIQRELAAIRHSAEIATSYDIQVNAGHGLNYQNVQAIAGIENIVELNIGHSIVAQSLFDGMQKAVADLKTLMLSARN